MLPTPSFDALSGFGYWRLAAKHTAASWRDMLSPRSVPANIAAGITVALVALPLNLALALACDLPPGVGLVTGAVAGVVGGLLGASRFQVTGPEVALAPLTLQIVHAHGYRGLLVVTFLAGVLQLAMGVLRLGRLVNAIPVPVIGGFMTAVGLLVFDSQLPRLLGMPADVRALSGITDTSQLTVDLSSLALGVSVIAVVLWVARIHPRLPAPLVALGVAIAAAAWLGLSVPTVDAIEGTWPSAALPAFGGFNVLALLPEALALAMLASIDSLLCARSVDMRVGGERTRSDQELVAQGFGNMASACVGGMPIAAAVVRSMAAVDAGATTRLAPIAQAVVLGVVLLALGGLAPYVPLVALAGILLIIGFRLIQYKQLLRMWRVARLEAAVFALTAAGIVATDFVIGIAIGIVAALVQFAVHQRSLLAPVVVTPTAGLAAALPAASSAKGPPGGALAGRAPSDARGDVGVIRLSGPLFFAAQDRIESAFASLDPPARTLVVDVSGVSTVDVSGAVALANALKQVTDSGASVLVRAGHEQPCDVLQWALRDSGVVGDAQQAPDEPERAADAIDAIDAIDAEPRAKAGTNGVSSGAAAGRKVGAAGSPASAWRAGLVVLVQAKGEDTWQHPSK